MHPLINELQHVLVAGHDHHVELFAGAPRDGADHVVRFEARILQHRDAHRFQQSPDVGDLLAQIGRHFGAIGFVAGESLLAKRLARFEDCRDVLGLVRRAQLAHHVVEDENRFSGKPSRSAHGRRGTAGAGVISAEDKPVAVDQKEPGTMPGAFLDFPGVGGSGHTIRITPNPRTKMMSRSSEEVSRPPRLHWPATQVKLAAWSMLPEPEYRATWG